MKLFMTGGTGYIGQTVARRAISLGHQVTALVREEGSAAAADKAAVEAMLAHWHPGAALDQTISGQQARRVLAWKPHGPGLIADLSAQSHFQPGNGA